MDKSNFPVRLQDELDSFFEQVPPARLGRNLRRLLLTHLAYKHDAYGMNIHELYDDLIRLFELLDVAEDELKIQNSKVKIQK